MCVLGGLGWGERRVRHGCTDVGLQDSLAQGSLWIE